MNPLSKAFIFGGLVLVALGLALHFGSKFPSLGLGRLPGDIVIKRENFRFYFPLTTSLLLSLLLTLIGLIIRYFRDHK